MCREKNTYRILVGNSFGSGHLEDQEGGRRIALGGILRK
jgi:hypothetical protein